MGDLWVALALAITIEGFAYALFPDGMKRLMANMLEMPSTNLRTAGLTVAFIGVGLVWLVRG